MTVLPLPKFDSAEYEQLLTDAGVEKAVAQAHRKGMALSQEHLVTNADLRAAVGAVEPGKRVQGARPGSLANPPRQRSPCAGEPRLEA